MIEFQALSLEGEDDHELDRYIVKIFGKTADGSSVYGKVSYNPQFYLECPKNWTDAKQRKLESAIKYKLQSSGMDEDMERLTTVKHKKFYGFTNHQYFNFIKLKFRTRKCMTRVHYMFKKPFEIDRKKIEFQLYEANFDPMLRFCHARDTPPAGWFKVHEYTICENQESTCDIEFKAKDTNIHYSDNQRIAPFVQASFDIETYSPDGTFPDPLKDDCYVIQIGTTLQRFGESEPYKKHLISFKGCKPIDGVEIECYDTEKEVLDAWADLIHEESVDILIGYNIWKFDNAYMKKRADKVGAHRFLSMGRLKDFEIKLKETQFSSSAYGDNDYEMMPIPGIFQIDLLVIMQREHKLSSYKLDSVAEHFLGEKKVDLSAKEMFIKWTQGDNERREVGIYCVQDTALPLRLVNKLAIIPNMVEMAKATWVPINFLIERGQGIKVFSQILQVTRKKDMLVVTLTKMTAQLLFEEVYKSEKKINFMSKEHRDIMTDVWNNLSPDDKKKYETPASFVKEYKTKNEIIQMDKDELIKLNQSWNELEDKSKYEDEYEGATVLGAKKGAYMEIPITGLDFASLYPTIMMAHNLCHSTWVNDSEYDNLPDVEYFEHDGQRFSQTIEGVLPEMLRTLAKNRKQAKKDMANAKKEGDTFMYAVYNGKQLAFKVSMNSIYGFCGAGVGALPCKPVAAITTSVGRGMIEHTKNKVEEWYPGSEVVYGDSVTGDTPLLIKTNDVNIVRIDKLDKTCEGSWYTRDDGKQEFIVQNAIQVYSDTGFTQIKRIIKHHNKKQIYRIVTDSGIVDVTEDHSLLLPDGTEIEPHKLKVGNILMHKDVPLDDIQSIEIPQTHKYTDGTVYESVDKSQLFLAELYAKKMGYVTSIDTIANGKICITCTRTPCKLPIDKRTVKSISIIDCKDEFVYDIETNTHHFHVGPGNMIVHNTDSVMVKFNVGELRGQDAIKKSFELGEEAANRISATFKKPIELEFEKVYNPYLLFSKKRYAGLMYGTTPDKPDYIDAKGIQLVRRDNCKMVRDTSKKILDTIMYQRDIQAAIQIVKDTSRKLMNREIDIMDLVVSKSLKRIAYKWDEEGCMTLEHGYKMASQPHLTVANKIESRDKGTGPKSGERVPYVFIDTGNPKDKQFVKAEDPDYAIKHNLQMDCKYYLEHSLLSPIQSLFELFLENPKEELFGEFLPKKKPRVAPKKKKIVIDV